MRLFRLIPVLAAAAALVLVPTVSGAQTQEATKTSKDSTKKKARKKAKETEEPAGEAARTAPQPPETPRTRTKAPATGSAERAMPTVPASEIAAAKASGKVWVNTETGVYHKGGRWYGATTHGKFMTEDEAIKAGYRASKSQ